MRASALGRRVRGDGNDDDNDDNGDDDDDDDGDGDAVSPTVVQDALR